MAYQAGTIPTIELARVSAAADTFVSQFGLGRTALANERMHGFVMALLEPELQRQADQRSSIEALRDTVADLQELVKLLSATPSPVPWLEHMPQADRQELNLAIAVAVGKSGSMVAAIEAIGDTVLPWVAGRIWRGNLAPETRLEAAA